MEQRTIGSHEVCSTFVSPTVSACLPEQFTAVGVVLIIGCFLQNTAEMKGQPAESKNQHQAEHRLRYFPPLHREGRQILMSQSSLKSYRLWLCDSQCAHQTFA